MGSSGKFAYTVIGDTVNLASRLEGANKEYRSTIMVSRRTYELVREEILGRELDVIAVKGRSEAVEVYELLAPREELTEPAFHAFLSVYEEGMRCIMSAGGRRQAAPSAGQWSCVQETTVTPPPGQVRALCREP